ncbi:MAG: hypothetical protein Q7I92_13065 [Humidesulfovibrio sp.]|nr:hypothetical protein [Humidesulfovibrio sp.]
MTTVSSTSSTVSALFDKQALEEIRKNKETSQTEAAGTGDGVSTVNGKDADQAKVSQFGKLMSNLQQLANTDQDAFKAAAQTIADNLSQSAIESSDPTQKEMFASISSQFAEAAKTGDMSSLKDVGQAVLGVSAASSGSVSGGDTVTISSEGKDLASKDGSTGSNDSGSPSAEKDATGADTASSKSSSLAAGQSKAAGGGGGSSSSDTTVSDLEDEIDDMKVKIKAMQAKVQQSQQEAKGDDSKADAVKTQQAQLNSLNTQLSQLQLEKLQAENETSSSSSGSAASGGASMTTHA